MHGAEHVALWIRPFVALGRLFERGFDRLRTGYHDLLGKILTRRVAFAVVFLALCAGSWVLVPFLGQDFFQQSMPDHLNFTCARLPEPGAEGRPTWSIK